jgi:serine/threonine-protein kinase
MDFGIARVRASDVRTKTGVLLGSPKYISPEQVRGQGADERSDIFSLGVVLYEMLSGAAPFSGDSVSSLMYQIATATPPAPSRANAAVPQMLDLVIAKALAKQPDERYQCAAELAADLRECGARLASRSPQRADDGTAAPAHAVRSPVEARGTRRLSSHFDSLQATRRMAAATGMQQALETHARTLRIEASAPSRAAPTRQNIDDRSRTGRASAPAWNREERLVLGASVTIAGIVAVFIALA